MIVVEINKNYLMDQLEELILLKQKSTQFKSKIKRTLKTIDPVHAPKATVISVLSLITNEHDLSKDVHQLINKHTKPEGTSY